MSREVCPSVTIMMAEEYQCDWGHEQARGKVWTSAYCATRTIRGQLQAQQTVNPAAVVRQRYFPMEAGSLNTTDSSGARISTARVKAGAKHR